jgi:hypothetical protein
LSVNKNTVTDRIQSQMVKQQMDEAERELCLEQFRFAFRSGADWLLARVNHDGSLGPVRDRLFYYRVPWALVLVGERSAAKACLDWIDRNMISRAGEFEGVSPRGLFELHYGSYPLACLLAGAQLVGHSDLVERGAPRLLEWQDPVTGGFYARWSDRSPECEQELFPACQAAMTLLRIGRVEQAERAGEWIVGLWDRQPEPDERLFHIARGDGGLVREFPDEEAAMYVTEKSLPWQHHFNGGISAAALVELFQVTGQPRWLQAARTCQAFSMTTDECQFESMQTCKSGWGSGLLWWATGELAYRDWTIRMGQWFCEHQLADGHWENTRHWTPEPTEADNIEITAEFVMHLANLVSFLENAVVEQPDGEEQA